MSDADFTWVDGERLLRFGATALDDAPRLLSERGFDGYALVTTERAEDQVPAAVREGADVVLHATSGAVPDVAAAVRDGVGGRPIVAFGGGRVIDASKGVGGADRLPVAAIPTTLSGAPFTRTHRMPAGVDEWNLVRPTLVIAVPDLMASAPLPGLAATAMNSLAHAAESLYTPLANPVAEMAALRAASLFSSGLLPEQPVRHDLALASLLGSYAIGTTGFAIHHITCQTIVRIAGTPHAQTNAVMLPHTVRFVEPRAPEQIGKLKAALGRPVEELSGRAGATTLGELGMTADQVDAVVDAAAERPDLASTPGGAPSRDELREFVAGAL